MASPGTISALPQELIDQIIDEVASFDDLDPRIRVDTLKSCALVSRAFSSRSRSHLLSTVNLVVDRFVQKRAGRLLGILRQKGTETVAIQQIHRFNLFLDVHLSDPVPNFLIQSGMDNLFFRIYGLFKRSLKVLGLSDESGRQFLNIMGDTSLTHFGLGSRLCLFRWPAELEPRGMLFHNALLRIVAKPSLRSLDLYNMQDLPQIYIKTAFQHPSLTSMRLSFVRFAQKELISSPEDSDAIQPVLATFETMTLRLVSYQALLAIIQSMVRERGITPRWVFSRVHTLAVSILHSRSEQEALWIIIQCTSPSLTTLKVESYTKIDMPSLDPITLNPLKSLEHLDLWSPLYRQENHVLGIPANLYLSDLLSSATSPMVLESINITLRIVSGSNVNFDALFHPSEGWSVLDNALNNPWFIKLKFVVVNVKAVIYDNDSTPVKDVQMKEPSQLLPIMTASVSVDARIFLITVKCAPDFRTGTYPFEW